MGIKIKIDSAGAQALREFAEAMPVAMSNIEERTNNIIQVYQSVAESVGPHEQDFADMLQTIKKAQEKARDAILELPTMLRNTADKIDDYVARKPSV